MNRRTGTLALLAALCVLAAAVQARSPTLRDAADDYCKACVDGQEPQYRLARCTDEVAQCESGHFCDCKSGKRVKCTWPWTRFNPDHPAGSCERNFDCKEWLNSHPVTPAPGASTTISPPAPSSSTTLPPNPTTGSTTNAPGPATRSTASGSSTATAGSTTKGPAPGSSTSKPAPVPGSSTSKPAPVPGSSTSKPAPVPGSSTSKPAPVPGSSTSKPAPAPGSSTSKPAPVPGSSTIKPKPNDAPWGHRAGLGLLALGVAAALL